MQNRRKGKGSSKGSTNKGKGKSKSKNRGRANLRPKFIPRSKQPNKFSYRTGKYKTKKIVKTCVGAVIDQDEPAVEEIEADIEELIEVEVPEDGRGIRRVRRNWRLDHLG